MKRLEPQIGDTITSFKLIFHNNVTSLITSFERTREIGVRPLVYEIISDPLDFSYSPGHNVELNSPTIEELAYWLYNRITLVNDNCYFLYSDEEDLESDYLMFTIVNSTIYEP